MCGGSCEIQPQHSGDVAAIGFVSDDDDSASVRIDESQQDRHVSRTIAVVSSPDAGRAGADAITAKRQVHVHDSTYSPCSFREALKLHTFCDANMPDTNA